MDLLTNPAAQPGHDLAFNPTKMLVWSLSQHAGRQQLPAGLFGLMQRLSHSQAGLLPLERLQQAVTPEVCAELSARVRGCCTVARPFAS